jgi:hypothetical protein
LGLPKSKKEESVLFCKNLKEQKPKKPLIHVNSVQSLILDVPVKVKELCGSVMPQ